MEDSKNVKVFKFFHDNVHSQIKLPLICARVINTPQFQRLKNLKQLGLTNYVFPAASHNRFEHCIGTSHLAGMYAKILQNNQPELGITDTDVTCLYLAGLCHDLGHGPLSHLWERFVNKAITDNEKKFEHEEMSVKLFRDIWTNLKTEFDNADIKEEGERKDKTFIEELIYGEPLKFDEKTEIGKKIEFEGRPKEKWFLYLIVSNGATKIDVDKFDYLLRDCRLLNIPITFEYERIMQNSKVIDGEIAYRKKVEGSLQDLFNSRFSLHKKAYQHRTALVIEHMVVDALLAVEDTLKIAGKNGESFTLATAHNDTSAYIQLTDSIAERILWGDGVNERAKKLFENVINRKLYTYLGRVTCFDRITPKSIKEKLSTEQNLLKYIIVIQKTIDFGGKGRGNPLNNVKYYDKVGNQFQSKKSLEPEEKTVLLVYPDEIPAVGAVTEEMLQEVKELVKEWSMQSILEYD